MRALILLLVLSLASASLPALAGPLNDTGIDFCRDHTSGTDTSVTPTTTCADGQDARYGRDPAAQRSAMTKIGGGSKGFDFTKVCMNGELAGQGTCPANPDLDSGPTDWACTYDNNTGLMWEVKTTSGLRSQDHTYTWYDSVHNYDGNAGTASGGSCATAGRCDTEKFVADVNALTDANRLCGHTDWRMPTKRELYNLADRGIAYTSGLPTIDASYFPNTPAWYFWSASPVAGGSSGAWGVFFDDGDDGWGYRDIAFRVRLVRAGQ